MYEVNYGMVIAAIYKFLIETQNEFFNIIINSSNENLKNYVKLFILEIMIQDCNKEEIVILPSFNDENKDSYIDLDFSLNNNVNNNANNNIDNIDLMKIIITNSNNYKNNYIEFNFKSIEDTLASLILPKIKRFKESEDCLRIVIYQYEGFRGKKKNIITNYIEKYEQRKLNDEETYTLVDFISKEQKKPNFNINNFLFSIHILIDIILSNNYDKNEKLYKIIMNIDDNSNISILKNFFENIKVKYIDKIDKLDYQFFTVDCLIDFMNFVENLCWEKIRNNLNKDYLIELSDDIKENIDKIYSNNNENKLSCSKELLSTALRRFISRYLIGKREENEIDSNNNLYHYLDKNELWFINIKENEKIKEDLNQIFIINENKYIIVGQATKLFDYLGGDLISLENLLKVIKEKEKEKSIEKMKEEKENYNNLNEIIYNKEINEINNGVEEKEEEKEEEEEEEEDEDGKKNEIIGY